MKRLISILLLTCLFLSACTNTPAETPTDSKPADNEISADVSEAVNDKPVYIQQPMYAVSVPEITQETTDEDDSVLFRHSYQNMRLVLQDPDVADKIIVDFLSRMDLTHELADDIHQQAQSAGYLSDPYMFSILYSPTRIDQSVLSLYGTTVSYSGGIHPDYNCDAANYDMVTGDVLTLGSILYNSNAIEPLYNLIIEQLEAIQDDSYLMSGYPETVKQRLFDDESHNEDWYFSATGLCFYFPPYEIAPYSSGTIIIEIPYEALTGIIGDAFFPPERTTADGTVNAIRYADADLEQFTQIAEVIIDQGGEMIFLYTDKAVYDVRIDAGYWDESGIIFTPSYTAFAAYTLTPGDAVMVETFIPDTMPNLRLTYTSDNNTVTVYISQSGEDGSILLLTE